MLWKGAEVINAEGLIVAPGLMDTHVHFRDQDLLIKRILCWSSSSSKVVFTSVVCMANTKPAVDNIETLSIFRKR